LRYIRARSALEALRNALYKCSTYLLTYLLLLKSFKNFSIPEPLVHLRNNTVAAPLLNPPDCSACYIQVLLVYGSQRLD